MPDRLRAYEMVEATTPDEIALMKQQRRIEEAQRLRRQKQAAQVASTLGQKSPPKGREASPRP